MEPVTENVASITRENKASSRPSPRARSRGKFYLIIGIVGLFIVAAGFFPTYITPMLGGKFIAKPYVHLHGAIFLLWILFSISQPLLINLGYTGLHKKIGVPLAVFAAGLVFMGVTMAIISARVDVANGAGVTPVMFLLIPLTDMVLFTIFVSLAVYYYKKPEHHKRLMLLATVAILPAAFGRLFGGMGIENPIVMVMATNAFVFAGMVYDYVTRKSIHPVYLTGGIGMIAVHLLRFPISQTEAWKSIAEAIIIG